MAEGLLDAQHTVLTPEFVEFEFTLAGIQSRMLAWLLDTLVTIGLSLVLLLVLSLTAIVAGNLSLALFFVGWFLIDWGYGIALEWLWSGQTIGKRALKLRVLQESGVRIGFLHAALRNLARPLDRLPFFYLVGGTAALFSSSQQRLGDLLAGTIVVREQRRALPASLERTEQFGAFSSDPQLLSRVARLSEPEQELLFSSALRREELEVEARLRLFAELARRLEQRLDLGKPDHLSDEKFVLGLTAVLAWKKRGAAPLRPAGVPHR